jgi:hypothetical protein
MSSVVRNRAARSAIETVASGVGVQPRLNTRSVNFQQQIDIRRLQQAREECSAG